MIATYFSGDEIKSLVTTLGGRWDFVFTEDDRTQDKALALVMWAQKHDLGGKLILLLKEERPGVTWE